MDFLTPQFIDNLLSNLLGLEPDVAEGFATAIIAVLGFFGVRKTGKVAKAKAQNRRIDAAKVWSDAQEADLNFRDADTRTTFHADLLEAEHRHAEHVERLEGALNVANERITTLHQTTDELGRSGPSPAAMVPIPAVDSLDLAGAGPVHTAEADVVAERSSWDAPPMPLGIKHIRGTFIDRNCRNNNVGNIVDDGTDWKGLAKPRNDGLFYRFRTPLLSARALARSCRNAVRKRAPSYYQFFARYAPKGHGKNDPVTYARFVASRMGVSPDTIPVIDSDDDCARFCHAIADHEGAHPWPRAMFVEGARLARK